MEIVIFKSDKSDKLVSVCTTADGKIDYRKLGSEFGLEPKSIRLCDILLSKNDDLLTRDSWTHIKNVLPVAGNKEAPVMVSAPTGLSSGVPKELLQDLAEFLSEHKEKNKSKNAFNLSSVSQSVWDMVQRQEGLDMMYVDIGPQLERLGDLPAFGWEEKLERSQAYRYIPHLNRIKSGRTWKLIDAANKHPKLLSCFFGSWFFKGTTDVAFVHRQAGEISERCALKCIFKLKKDLSGGHHPKAEIQIVICLVMANVLAKQFKPFAVLTDLPDRWFLYWMDGTTICCYKFESRARAVGHIEELLQDSNPSPNEVGTSETLASCEGPHDMKKRKMYEPPGMDKLKNLVGLIPDEEMMSAQAQLAFQHAFQQLLHVPLFSDPDVDEPCPSVMYC